MQTECFGEGPFVFRVNEGTGPQLLIQVCLERGWKEFTGESGEQWNLWWKNSGFSTTHHRTLSSWQYINHIPKGSAICRKDNLARYLKCMKNVYGSIYNFSPHCYNLPLEYTKLAAEYSKSRMYSSKNEEYIDSNEEYPIWIYKPVSQSQGRGIFLFRKLSELTYDANAIVQKYIEKPLLIGGYKFDLRLYVCVPSYHPITVYMYREGLTRFSTDKFSLHDLRNPFRHLTNTSLNKLGPGYFEMKDRIGSGCKWTLRQLRRYFQQAGIHDWLLWQRISSLVVLTLLSQHAQIPPSINCFEFFGFDVLVDASLRPWLLEVNLSPALGNDCDADRAVKKPMLHDLFDLLGLPLYNTGLSVLTVWSDNLSPSASCLCCIGERIQMEKNSAVSIITAAEKWKRKHRKDPVSYKCCAMHSKNQNSSELPKVATSRQKPVKCPPNKALIKPIMYKPNFSDPLSQSKQVNEELKKSLYTRYWGNGRNWDEAPVIEGGWVKIWPINKSINNDNTSIKNMVGEVTKFSKLAKNIPKRYPNGTEVQWNDILKQSLNFTSEIWLPDK